jgi:hypothetical protein
MSAQRLASALRRFALRTARGPLRLPWSILYRLALRGYVLFLTRGQEDVSVYAAGSLGWGEPAYGLSDIDVAVVLGGDAHRQRIVRGRVRRRWAWLERTAPIVAGAVLDRPLVVAEDDLKRAVGTSVLTYGLDEDPGPSGTNGALYLDPAADGDRVGVHLRPGLYGPGMNWRLITGIDRRAAQPAFDPQASRIAAWLELQSYWRWLLQECVDPEPVRTADICVKLVAEPVRILLWLTRRERVSGRAEVLERGRDLLPDEEPVIRAALELRHRRWRSPGAPLAEFLPSLVHLSSRVGSHLAEAVATEGSTRVRLAWGGPSELIVAERARSRLGRLGKAGWAGRIVPLADWRALASPEVPDETLAPLTQAPTDPSLLALAATVGNSGAYPALRAGGLLVLASHRYPRSALRGVQCAVTDPVSFALLADDAIATFPEVRGWSARDWGRRAVAEHRVWLESGNSFDEEPGQTLARLLTAARAGVFLESIEAGTPELPLTVVAAAERLGLTVAEPSLAEEAAGSYRKLVLEELTPAGDTVRALRKAVLGLRAYSDHEELRRQVAR